MLLESIAAWIPAAADVAEISLDAAGLPLYGEKSLVELPPAVDMAAQTVRGRIIPDVLAGNKPPVIASKPTLVPAVLAPAEPPSFALFALQHLLVPTGRARGACSALRSGTRADGFAAKHGVVGAENRCRS